MKYLEWLAPGVLRYLSLLRAHDGAAYEFFVGELERETLALREDCRNVDLNYFKVACATNAICKALHARSAAAAGLAVARLTFLTGYGDADAGHWDVFALGLNDFRLYEGARAAGRYDYARQLSPNAYAGDFLTALCSSVWASGDTALADVIVDELAREDAGHHFQYTYGYPYKSAAVLAHLKKRQIM